MKRFLLLILIFGVSINFTYAQQIPQEVLDLIGVGGASDPTQQETGIDATELLNLYNQAPSIDRIEQISISASPLNPRANETVRLKVRHYTPEFNNANYTWSVDGQVQLSQVGAKQFSFQVGENGETTIVRVTIDKAGGSVTRTYSFKPADVELIYEADTVVNPFYKGLPLFTRQSLVRVVAYPEIYNSAGSLIPSNELVYNWFFDGELISDQSGYGKMVFQRQAGVISKDGVISVEVYNDPNDSVAKNSISIPFQNPLVLVYEKNPVYGTIFSNAVSGTFGLDRNEIEFEAVPYFFNNLDYFAGNTEYRWVMNGQNVNSPINQRTLTFRSEDNQSGQASISLEVSNNSLLQSDSTNFELIFGDTLQNFSF